MSTRRPMALAAAVLVALALGLSALWLANSYHEHQRAVIRIDLTPREGPPAPELMVYKPLTPEQAAAENAALPFSTAPLEPASPLHLPASALALPGSRNATDCLTAAIYYEAGNESVMGKRAVAQVVLNRARHPAFPASVCGVVYQGSERRTGCQFSFTCDGSLARQPSRSGWDAARQIAIGALSGIVEPSVGMATHYHADYVVPYWASSLDKIVQIGTHIFYKWKGSYGRRATFQQTVRLDDETLPALLPEQGMAVDPALPGTDPLALPNVPSPIRADEGAVKLDAPRLAPGVDAPKSTTLRADETKGTLTADEQAPSLKGN